MKKKLIIQCLGLLSQIRSIYGIDDSVTDLSYSTKDILSKTNTASDLYFNISSTEEYLLADKIRSLTEKDILKNIELSAQKKYPVANNYEIADQEEPYENFGISLLEEQFSLTKNIATKADDQHLNKAPPEPLSSFFNRILLGNADLIYEDEIKTPYKALELTNYLINHNVENLKYIGDKIGDIGDSIVPKEAIYNTASNIRNTTYSTIETIPLLGPVMKDITLKLEEKIDKKFLKPYYDVDSFLPPPAFRNSLEAFSAYIVLRKLDIEHKEIQKLYNTTNISDNDAQRLKFITKAISKYQKTISDYIKNTGEYLNQFIPSYTKSAEDSEEAKSSREEHLELANTEKNNILDSTINVTSSFINFIYTTLQTSIDDKNFEEMDEIILNTRDLRALDIGILELLNPPDDIISRAIDDTIAIEKTTFFSENHDKDKSTDEQQQHILIKEKKVESSRIDNPRFNTIDFDINEEKSENFTSNIEQITYTAKNSVIGDKATQDIPNIKTKPLVLQDIKSPNKSQSNNDDHNLPSIPNENIKEVITSTVKNLNIKGSERF